MQEMVEAIQESNFPAVNKDTYCVVRKTNPDEPTRYRLFVYGTLKRDYGNNRMIATGTFLGEAVLHGYAMLHKGSFPAICKEQYQARKVYGEVWEINSDQLAACDRLEGIPNHYQREAVYVPHYEYCFTYTQYMPVIGTYKRVESGKWEGPSSTCIEVLLSNPHGAGWTAPIEAARPRAITHEKPSVGDRATIWGLPKPYIIKEENI